MNESRLNRRRFLEVAGVGLCGAIAGCVTPEANSASPADTGDETGTGSGSPGELELEPPDPTIYQNVYEDTIDSVTFLRVFGVENPYTGDEDRGQGSGFRYDDRYVVTNEHVVYGGDEVDVRYAGGDWATTELVGVDYYSDLAVLEVDHVPETATPLSLSGTRPTIGQQVLAIGNPYGLEGSMTTGIVSGVNRAPRMQGRQYSIPNVIQTDAAVNPGNSGGPLVDLEGDVVGVINAGGGDNIGFAISAALTQRVVPALIDDGEYAHSYMGISLETVDRVIARENDLPEVDGVIVVSVPDGGPADGVLRPSEDEVRRYGEPVPVGGDVILEMDGQPISNRHALATFLALETSPGDTIPVEIYRDGSIVTVELTLDRRPQPQ